MARPMTPEQIKITADAKKRAETAEYKQHLAAADAMQPTDKPPIDPPLASLDPLAGQA
jgi:hypothetical protein